MAGKKGRDITIEVNGQAVVMANNRDTGLEIKQAAIAQGVDIEIDFQLTLEEPGKQERVIGDDDIVTINKNSVFTANAGDDNS
jgi:hypothetical protein